MVREAGPVAAAPKPASSRPGRTGEPSGAREFFSLERLIGAKWYAVLGALLVTIGVGLGLKWAYDAGWIRVSPWGRIISAGALGVAMLGLGEWARRRVNLWAAVGCSAAGLGILYTAAFLGYSLYGLYPAGVAMAVLAVVAGVGLVAGARARLATVSAIALIGGYFAPALTADADPSTLVVLAAYTLALLASGLGLAGALRGNFLWLRTMVWLGSAGWGLVIALSYSWTIDERLVRLGFVVLFWALVHGELVWSAFRADREREGLPVWRPMAALPPGVGTYVFPHGRALAGSISTTAYTATLGAAVLAQRFDAPTWLMPSGLLAVTLALSLVLAGHLRVFRDAPRGEREGLGAVLMFEGGALLIAVVALALSGWLQVVAWIAMGVAAVAAGRWIGSRALDLYGFAVLSIAGAQILLVERALGSLPDAGQLTLGIWLSKWSVLCAAAGAGWLVAAALMHRFRAAGPPERPPTERSVRVSAWMATVAAGVGAALVALAPFDGRTAYSAWAVYVAALSLPMAAAGRLVRSRGLEMEAGALVAGAALLAVASAWWGGLANLGAVGGGSVAGFIAEGFGLVFTAGSMGALLVGAAAVAAGGVVHPSHAPRAAERPAGGDGAIPPAVLAGRMVSGLGWALVLGCLFHTRADPGSLAVAWLLISLALTLTRPLARRFVPPLVEYGGLYAASAAWLGAWAGGGVREVGRVAFQAPLLAIGAGVAAGWFAAGLLALRAGPSDAGVLRRGLAGMASACACVALVLAPVVAGLETTWLPLAWAAAAAVVAATRFVEPRMGGDLLALGPLALATLGWLVRFPPFDWGWRDAPPLLHPGLLSALGIAGSWLVVGFHTVLADRGQWARQLVRSFAGVLAGVLMFISTSAEVARITPTLVADPNAQRAAVSLWFGVFAVGLLVVGFLRSVPPVRWAGLGLLGFAAVKVVLYDLAGVSQGARVVSFLGVGVLMLAVAFAYARIAAAVLRSSDGTGPGPYTGRPPDA
ncbi:MAG: DUF2339 domain-containing protein [Phycisphaerales bacterium]|nr:DUF2339 domain-containing protein [Phycisphaerales bacterium]